MVRTPAPRRATALRVLLALLVAVSGLPALSVLASAAGEAVTIRPENAGDLAVRAGQFVLVEGTAPDGPIAQAALIAVERDGDEVRLPLDDGVLNRPSSQDAYLRNDGGTLTGRLVLGCAFADPAIATGCSTAVDDVVAVRLDLTVGSAALSSPPLRVDYVRPSIIGYRLVARDKVEARFSEPVRGDDNPADFTVEDGPVPSLVTAVTTVPDDCGYLPPSDGRADRSGCTRILDLLMPLPEDATPLVTYDPAANRPLYRDDASNLADRSSRTTATRSRAVDAIRPAAPVIDAVSGARPSGTPPTTSGRDAEPDVELSNLTAGQEVRVVTTTPSGLRSATDWQRVEPPATPVQPTTAVVVVRGLVEQGGHVLAAQARDDNGNLSTDDEQQPSRSDGAPNPVTYVLDSIPPALVAANSQGGTEVLVSLSEPVTGPDEPADWTVTAPDGSPRQVTRVSGEGAQRTLDVTGVPDRSVLRYQPAGDRYADAAGNELLDGAVVIGALALPQVTDPTSDVVTQAASYVVRGTAPAGSRVELMTDADRDGAPDSATPVASQQLAAGETDFAIEVPLPASGAVRLVAVAADGATRSGASRVPSLTRDDVAPALDLTSPDGGEVLPGGAEREITWTHDDANPGQVLVEYSADGGATYEELTPGAQAEDESYTWRTPATSSERARIRLTARDLAGNVSTDESADFVVDALTPVFGAVTRTARRVDVVFAEPVTGPVSPSDFRVEGTLVTSAERQDERVIVLTTASDIGPDATPEVEYAPTLAGVAGQLVDRAGQPVDEQDRLVVADDGIRPAVPSISSVDERAPAGELARGDDAAPTVGVSGLQPDNDVWVEVVGTGERGAVVRSSGSTAELPAPALGAQGAHVLLVVAQDPAGNLSTDATQQPGTADGSPNPVTYLLDSIAPVLLTAATEGGKVRVRFSEPVVPDGGTPGDWQLVAPDRTVTAVEGTGDTRLLTVSGPPAGAQLTYRPTGARYTDPTGNPVADTTLVVDGLAGDVQVPQITVRGPAAGTVLAGASVSAVPYTTSDDNPGRLDVEITTDGGSSWSPLGTVADPANGDGSFPFTVPDVETDAAQVRITAVDRAGNSAQALSPVFTIDALNPTFVALTTAPRTVRLTFSEPVSGRISPLTDFRVDGQPATVTSIEGSPATTANGARAFELTVPSGVGEDARPAVTYTPSPLGELVDRAQQGIVERTVTAVDGIRPAVPTVTAVDGRAPQDGRVRGGSVVPQVSVANLVAGQFVRVERVLPTGLPVAGPEVETQGGSALVPGPRLPDDGEHVLRVVVRDATGNASTDTAKSPGRSDGGPSSVTYVLDTQLPAILFAVADSEEILVRFTEALFPAGGQPADWRVTRPDGSPVPLGDGSVTVVAVRGAGDTRVLQATGVQPGSLLVYSPVGERYADAHANPLPDTTTPLLAFEPPIVTTPARALLVTTSRTAVGGTSQPGSTVSLFRRGGDGGPSGAAVASAGTGDDGRWSLSAPLEVDVANDFLVQARRTDGRTTIAVPVPTITQDSASPVLSVDGFPGDQQRLAPGSARTLSWSVCDANLGATPIVLEFSADDGASWTRLGPERLASPNDCAASTSRRVTLPGTAETSSARLRVSAIDLAGRTTRIDSPRFVLTGDTVVRDVRGYACPPERVQPAGFTDTATSTFRFEIDCLAAYRFTKGVTADRYEPLGDVTRAQMALFVARVAAYAGVPLNTSDAGFTDMGGRSQETRDAVNALANLGVVQGVGGGRYAPADPVSRGQMASFLARVQRSVGTPFPVARDAFRDDDRTTHEANINAIAGAGIVQGTAPGTYQPLAPITRQQMAGFLVRYVDSQVEAGRMRSAY